MISKYYKSISEVSELLNLDQHVIRYWDSKFEGVSVRLDDKKRRYFNPQNIKKLQSLKNLLHTNGKSHYSLELAKNILENNTSRKNLEKSIDRSQKILNIRKLTDISHNLKKLI